MDQECDNYRLTREELGFLDRLITKMKTEMPRRVKTEYQGTKDSLVYKMEYFVEGLLEDLSTQRGLERTATTEKAKSFARYLADKLYAYVNSNIIL